MDSHPLILFILLHYFQFLLHILIYAPRFELVTFATYLCRHQEVDVIGGAACCALRDSLGNFSAKGVVAVLDSEVSALSLIVAVPVSFPSLLRLLDEVALRHGCIALAADSATLIFTIQFGPLTLKYASIIFRSGSPHPQSLIPFFISSKKDSNFMRTNSGRRLRVLIFTTYLATLCNSISMAKCRCL